MAVRHDPANCDDFEQIVVCPHCSVRDTIEFHYCHCCPENAPRGECPGCSAEMLLIDDDGTATAVAA